MDDTNELVRAAGEAWAGRRWREARDGFAAALAQGAELSGDDLMALADCAWWLGLADEATEHYGNAYRLQVAAGIPRAAAMCCLAIAVTALLRGQEALGSAWLSRARRQLRGEPESAEHGYLLYAEVEAALDAGDLDDVVTMARRLQDMGRRHDSADLIAVGTLAEGRALVRRGAVREGMALLDEAMLAAMSDELDPGYAGNIYCHLIAACMELGDLGRAGEWVRVTEQWLAGLQAAALFSGICRVHRAQLLWLQGDWSAAEHEAARVCEELVGLSVAVAAEGRYALGEIHRVRGDAAAAEQAYTQAHRLGRDPQPGLALLRLAQGRPATAAASIAAALTGSAEGVLPRVPLWAAQLEIALAAGDVATAGSASERLDEAASRYASPGVLATALWGQGAVALAAGDAPTALPALRASCGLWQELSAPYDVARVRVLLAQTYRLLGDADAERLELDAAADAFMRLGAVADRHRVARLRVGGPRPDGLTQREIEVLQHVAAGRTNRQVAAALVISEKTVARHLSNIAVKLGTSSRTAAAAYAFRNDLAAPSTG